MTFQKLTKLLFAFFFVALSLKGFAAGVQLNTDENDVAVKGYDVVSYFKRAGPVKGDHKYVASYNDAIYHFANAKNRDAFKAQPEKYVPQFGGYCAMGVALNKKLDVDPLAYRVVDGKLYLNLNKQVQKKWLSDTDGYIASANRNWFGINSLTVAELNDE